MKYKVHFQTYDNYYQVLPRSTQRAIIEAESMPEALDKLRKQTPNVCQAYFQDWDVSGFAAGEWFFRTPIRYIS